MTPGGWLAPPFPRQAPTYETYASPSLSGQTSSQEGAVVPERRMLQNRLESAQSTFLKNQSPGQQPTGVRGLGAGAIIPRSQLAAGGSAHSDSSADTGASLGRLYSVPKGTARAGTPLPGGEEEWGCAHLYLFVCCLELLVHGWGCRLPHGVGVCPGQALPCSQPLPGLGKRLGAQSMEENPGDVRSKKKDQIRRLLLFLTGGVHTHCRFPMVGGRVPRMTLKKEEVGWRRSGAPEYSRSQLSSRYSSSSSHPSGIYLLPPGSGHSYFGARGRKFFVCWEQVLSFPPELPRTWWTKGTGGSLLRAAAAQWLMTA